MGDRQGRLESIRKDWKWVPPDKRPANAGITTYKEKSDILFLLDLVNNIKANLSEVEKERDELSAELKRVNKIKASWTKKSRKIVVRKRELEAENANLKEQLKDSSDPDDNFDDQGHWGGGPY